MYSKEMEEGGYSLTDFRSEKLKSHLEKHEIGGLIGFTKVNPGDKGFISYILVFNASMNVTDALKYSYKLGSQDKYEEVALSLRNIIQQVFRKDTLLPWPTPDDLDIAPSIPEELVKFIMRN